MHAGPIGFIMGNIPPHPGATEFEIEEHRRQ